MKLSAGFITGMSLLFLVVSGVSVPAQNGASEGAKDVDASLSHLYARYANSALEDGRSEEAAAFAETALEFSPQNPDALHIRARTLLEQQEETQTVVSHLESALSGDGRFRLTRARAARHLLAETYLRVGRYGDAFSVLEGVLDEPAPEPDTRRAQIMRTDATTRYLYARSLLGMDEVEEAERVAAEGRNRFPEDPRFFLLLLRRDRIPGPRSGRWLDQHVSPHPAYLEALLYYAQRSGNTARTRELAERYLRLGGEDPEVAVMLARVAAERNEAEQQRAAWDRFVAMGGLDDKGAVEAMFQTLPAGTVKERVREVLSDYDGTLEYDEDGNGYWEARFHFEEGELRRWIIDQNQNGEIDYDIEMTDRVPQELSSTPEGYELEYGSYPELSWVLLTQEDRPRRYRLKPGNLTYDILDAELEWSADMPGPAFPFSLSSSPIIIGEELLRRHAYRLEILESGDRVTRVSSLSEGTVTREVYDEDGDGRVDRIVSFDGGEPKVGIRDADRDGRFEITEQYRNGERALLLVDRNGDGTVDYREQLLPERSQGWDYDGDGAVNVERIVSGGDEVLRRYSRADGDLDLSMTTYRETVPYE